MKARKVVFPIVSNDHWTLAEININQRRMTMHNSAFGSNHDKVHQAHIKRMTVRHYLIIVNMNIPHKLDMKFYE